MGQCRGNCNLPNSGFKKPSRTTKYADEWKYCRTCQKAVKWVGVYCPCCGNTMRHRSPYTRDEKAVARY